METQFTQYIDDLQQKIITELERIDGQSTFKKDKWQREEGGGGLTCVLENGHVFEKAGVNVSKVFGDLPPTLQKKFKVTNSKFFACGLSLVIHPKNPFIPTSHANWRYFKIFDDNNNVIDEWFGGGMDLTPYYLNEDDAKHWHNTCKNTCDLHHESFYEKYKKECDNYFWNTHRNEARGIGGLFFDYLRSSELFSLDDRFNFVTAIGDSFLLAYIPIVEKNINHEYSPNNRFWQEVRRGRYVEFNLIHDRGTLFGLKTNGRIESILMSLPPVVQWHYNFEPQPNSLEEELINVLRHPKKWI